MKNTKLQNLEKKFGMATSLVEDLDDAISELNIEDNLPEIGKPTDGVVAPEESIMDMSSLRQDFSLVRANVLKLVHAGQKILDKAGELDLADLKPSHIEALASLQSTIGNNLKLMMDIYKDIASIEKSRVRAPVKQDLVQSNVNTGQITNNNILFTGSSADLMELINNQGKPKELEVISTT
jgi:hypothetical protein